MAHNCIETGILTPKKVRISDCKGTEISIEDIRDKPEWRIAPSAGWKNYIEITKDTENK